MSDAFVPPRGSVATLEVPDLSGIRSVHLIGIGGYGMRSLARMLIAQGVTVAGSDLKDRGLDELRALGATVFVGHRPEQVGDPDAVIVSSAVLERNVELREARRLGLPVLARAQVLAALAAPDAPGDGERAKRVGHDIDAGRHREETSDVGLVEHQDAHE